MRITDTRACRAALKAKDARFDGRFFVGVSSTGIYCRPVCPAKLPKEENCTFYESAAAAEQAGYRPCLMCRPELAPGAALIDAGSALACRAARLLEEHCGSGQSTEEYARRLGCSDRHLRRIFAAAFKVAPVQYIQTCRLLLAKSLLTDTDLSATDVAMAAGFGSLRRFNALFRKQYRLSPTALRRRASSAKEHAGEVALLLGYRPPYQWRHIIGFLAERACPGVEIVNGDSYLRTVHCVSGAQKHVYGLLRVGHLPEKNALAVTLSSALLPALPRLLARVRTLFDLHCCPDVIYETLAAMNTLRPGLCAPGIRLPGCFEPFETAVRAILEQRATVREAGALTGKLAQTYGTPVETGVDGLTHAFPTAHDIAALPGDLTDHLGPLGIPEDRAAGISALAQKIATGELDFTSRVQEEAEMETLTSIPGIGARTAQHIAMRAGGCPDAFPHTDPGVRKALAPLSEEEILKTAEAWRPWRAYATMNLWNSL